MFNDFNPFGTLSNEEEGSDSKNEEKSSQEEDKPKKSKDNNKVESKPRVFR